MNGFAVGIGINYNGQKITQSPVPLQLLGPSIEPYAEAGNVLVGTSTATEFSAGAVKLEGPIYLAPGERLDILLQHRQLVPSPIKVSLTIGGRLIKTSDVPKNKYLPYFAAWTPPTFPTLNVAASQASSEKDLSNGLDMPVEIRRIVGKIAYITTQSGGQANFPVITDAACADWYDSLLTVDLRSHDGIQMTPSTTTPFGAAFPSPRRSIEVPHMMRPGAFVRGILTLAATQDAVPGSIQAGIALCGYRRIL